MEFIITKEHIKLLRKSYWRFEDCEYGAPAMDCKRPYGNSDVAGDIGEILGWDIEVCPHCGEVIGDDYDDRAMNIHQELVEVIKLIILTLNEDDYPERVK